MAGAESLHIAWVPTLAEAVEARRYRQRWRWRGGLLASGMVGLAFAASLVDDLGHGAWLAFPVAAGVMGWGVWRAPMVAARRAGPAAEQQLWIAPDALWFEVEGVRSRVPWAVVEAPVLQPAGLHLRFGASQVFVPQRVLPPGTATRVSACRAGGPPPPAETEPPEGYGALVFRYRATVDDYLAFARRVERRGGLAAMPYAAGALLVGSVVADRGLDLLALLAIVGWTVLLALSSVAQRTLRRWERPWRVWRRLRDDPERLPRGPVTVGLGPAGGWVDGPRGASMFTWPEVRHVDADAHAIVLLFGDVLGTVIPARAVDGPSARADLLEAIATWRRDATVRGPRAPRGEAPDAPPPPFAPPRQG